jgi:hypothetical protein
VPGTIRGFGAWHHSRFQCLAPFEASMPGTIRGFGAWHQSRFRCLAPFEVSVPGTIRGFCAWHQSRFRCLAPFEASVPVLLLNYDFPQTASSASRLPAAVPCLKRTNSGYNPPRLSQIHCREQQLLSLP